VTQGVVSERLKNEDRKKAFLQETELQGDSKKRLQLAWSGQDFERIIILTGDDEKPSTLYISDAAIKNLTNITNVLPDNSHTTDLALVKHPIDSKLVFIISNQPFVRTSNLTVTVDGGETFKSVSIPFQITGQILFHPSSSKSNYILAVDDSNNNLYLTEDKGFNWRLIKSNVVHVKWSTLNDSSDIYVMSSNETNFFIRLLGTSRNNTLERSTDLGLKWKTVFTDVFTFGMEGKFLYTSVYVPQTETDERFLVVSTDNGTTWNHARLPSITPDRFYSILDSSDGQIFLHVDNPGDTGHGTLYTSDATGIVYSESLENHLYPNYDDVTDFYRVDSMRGVYIANRLATDDSIHTMITFNRGADWQPIRRPDGVTCLDETNECYLQIHNQYSIKRGIAANPPLSVSNAVGIILAHGQIASALQMTDPDVFVSSDGGYTWTLALKGPHHYQIADHGGLLVAVPADSPTPNVIKFSVDAGHCWISYNFTEEKKVVFTGLLVEPRNRAMLVAVWGYTEDTRIWHTFIINFTSIIERQCGTNDYVEWLSHDHNDNNGCLLGSKQTYRRVRADSWCYNGMSYVIQKSNETCPCTKDDYDCDFGYHRVLNSEECTKEPTLPPGTFTQTIDICLRGHEEKLVPLGYHKIPGDVCVAGFTPPASEFINMTTTCTDDHLSQLKSGVSDKNNSTLPGRARAIVLGLLVFLAAVLFIIFVTFIAKKYRRYLANRPVMYRYSSIKCEEDGDAAVEALRRTTSLYDDGSDSETSDAESRRVSVSSKPAPSTAQKHSSLAVNGRIPNRSVSNGQLLNGDVLTNRTDNNNTNVVNSSVKTTADITAPQQSLSPFNDDTDDELLK